MIDPVELGPFPGDEGYEAAAQLDQADPLADYAAAFVEGEPDLIYLDGNSLGRPPRATAARINDLLAEEWAGRLIRSWPEKWWTQADRIGGLIAELIGADPARVIVADSTSIVLFKLTLGALQARPERSRVITDDLNFPTDNYITDSAARLAGCSVETVGSDGINGPVDSIIAALDDDTALLTLSHVLFKSGYLYDMERLTAAAHDVGALVLWDLSHSVGAVPIDLQGCNADLAVGCTYKYLNGGPGSPAFLYVSEAVAGEVANPVTGWWGHANPFAFELDYTAAPSIHSFQTGTMPILSLAATEPGVRMTIEAGIDSIRKKSLGLSSYFIELAQRRLTPLGFALASPLDPARRGSHVSLRHPEGWPIVQAMVEDGKVIPDFREPDNIRFGMAPLYTSYLDLHSSVGRIARIVESERHRHYPSERSVIT
ncbi:MAG: kynureninase [Acidimicrobiia bacterium]|nr:kynureninase [Acidimicrobiia bacterium]